MNDKERRERFRAADPEMFRGYEEPRTYSEVEYNKLKAENARLRKALAKAKRLNSGQVGKL